MASRRRNAESTDRLESLSEEALHCRDLGHAWRPYRAEHLPNGGWARTMRCRSCACLRIQHLDRFGHPRANRYQYPEMYLLNGGFTVDDRANLRLYALRALLERGGDE